MIISLIIDGKQISVNEGVTVLQAAQKAGIYVPSMCNHPDLTPEGECGICTVDIGSFTVPACATRSENGMVVQTSTDRVKTIRRDKLSAILLHHPHACLTCAQKVGCSRTQCSSNVAVNERCCSKLGNCEIERLVEYVGLRDDLGRYVYQDLPKFNEEPLITRDYNLCIGCTRCVRVCNNLAGANVVEAFEQNGRTLVRAKQETLKESGCKFCAACVEVCPTGALRDKDFKGGNQKSSMVPRKSKLRMQIHPVPKPPEKWHGFDPQTVARVPECEGVFRLLDDGKNIIHIVGTANLRECLQEYLGNDNVYYFDYEEEPMYTQRESQLLQQYLEQFGKLPAGNDDLDDLF